jgi:hypothetical protein
MAKRFPSIGKAFNKLADDLDRQLLMKPIEDYIKQVEAKAIEKAPTSKIKSNLSAIPPTKKGKEIRTGIEVDINRESGAPEAPAYEYGSGIHGEKREKYPIVPREKQALAFFWDKADPSRHIILPDGRVLFRKVQHPGVEAKPYITPSFNELKVSVLIKLIKNTIGVSLMATFRGLAE